MLVVGGLNGRGDVTVYLLLFAKRARGFQRCNRPLSIGHASGDRESSPWMVVVLCKRCMFNFPRYMPSALTCATSLDRPYMLENVTYN